MRKPEVTLENHSAVYDYYRDRRQNRIVTAGVYWLLDRIYLPEVHYAPGAKDQLEEAIETRAGLEVAVNHVSYKDPQVVGGVIWDSPLRHGIGRITALAKHPLFVGRGRMFFDETGGVPVFRSNDHDLRSVYAAGQELFDVCAERLEEGGIVGIFPEGTVNSGDTARIMKLHSGVGHIACRAFGNGNGEPSGADVRLMTIGLDLGMDGDPHGARAYIGNVTPMQDVPRRMLDADVPSPADVTRFMSHDLQNSVTMAIAARR